MVITLSLGAYLVYGMGRLPKELDIAYVQQESGSQTEVSGKVVYPTLCHYKGTRQWILFDKSLREGDTVYFIPYFEYDEKFRRGYVKEVLKK